MIWAFYLALAAVPAMAGFAGIEGLVKGVVRAKNGSYSRRTNPRWFWACETIYFSLIALWAYLGARVYLGS